MSFRKYVIGDAKDLLGYYSSCAGINPLHASLETIRQSTLQLNTTTYILVNSTQSPCYHDPQLMQTFANINNIYTQLGVLEYQTSCVPTSTVWSGIVETGTTRAPNSSLQQQAAISLFERYTKNIRHIHVASNAIMCTLCSYVHPIRYIP